MSSVLRLDEGTPDLLGASFDGAGVNFALFSTPAEKPELCLFGGVPERARLALLARTGDVWHSRLSGAQSGPHDCCRAYGPSTS